MENILVSIIMGAYNEEKTIAKCLDSIIAQTYKNWEFIICDDCSTDKTANIVEEYAKSDPRIILIKNKTNSRLAASLNNCLSVASGEYVARMDADDIALPERLEKQVEFLNSNPDIAVVGCAAKIFDGEKIIEIRKSEKNPDSNDVLYGPPFMHPAIMMRKSNYDALGGYTVSDRTKRGQDWDLWFRFFAAGYKGANLDEPLLIYHESPDDYKKRTLKAAIGCTKTALYGFKTLNVKGFKYLIAFKPVVSHFIPETLKRKYRNQK